SRVAPRRSRERQRERPRDRSPRTPPDLLERAVDIDWLATDGRLIMAADQHVTDRAGRQGHHDALGGGELQDHVPPRAVDVHVTGAGAAVDVAVGEQLAADRPGHGLVSGDGEGHEHYERVVWAPGELAPADLGRRRPPVAGEARVPDRESGHWRSPPSAG